VGDYPSRDLFQEILREEEEHIDYLETQLGLMERIGEERYVLLNSDSAKDAE
jgi:bacterioferritin